MAVGVGVTYPNTAQHVPQRFHGGPPQVVRLPPRAPFTAADRRRVEAVLQVFVDHAVARRDAATAYDVVTPAMRRGTTRAQWAAGNVPVYPYPAARQRVQIAWVWASYRNEVDFDVVLLPRKGAGVGPMSAGVASQFTERKYCIMPSGSRVPGSTTAAEVPGGGGSLPVTVRCWMDCTFCPRSLRCISY